MPLPEPKAIPPGRVRTDAMIRIFANEHNLKPGELLILSQPDDNKKIWVLYYASEKFPSPK